MKRISYTAFLVLIHLSLFGQNSSIVTESCYDVVDMIYYREQVVSSDSGWRILNQQSYDEINWTTQSNHPYIFYYREIEIGTNGLDSVANYYRKDTSDWVCFKRTHFQFDLNNIITDSIVTIDSSGVFVNSYWWHKAYLTASILVHEERFGSGQQWLNSLREEWYYDQNGMDTLYLKYDGNQFTWVANSRAEKHYGASGIIDSAGYFFTGGLWVNSFRKEFLYSAQGYDSLNYGLNGNGQQWDSTNKEMLTYDLQGNLVVYEASVPDSGIWETNQRITYVRDLLHRVLVETIESTAESTALMNETRNSYAYDSYGLIMFKSESWVDTTWVPTDSITYEYFGSHYSYRRVEYYYSSGSWYPIDDNTFIYDSLGNLIHTATDNHIGLSGGYTDYQYDSTGFCTYYHSWSSTMGGIINEWQCHIYKPLIFLIKNYNYSACSGDTLVPEGFVTGGVMPYIYFWSTDGSSNYSTLNPNVVTLPGDHWYRLTVGDSISNYFCDSVFISSHFVEVNIGNDSTFCLPVNFTLSPGNNFSTYQWQDGSTSISLAYVNLSTQADTVIFWVQVSDSTNCENRDSVTYYLEDCLNINSPVDKYNLVFPNPAIAGKKLYINSTEIANEIQLICLNGKVLQSLNNENSFILSEEIQSGVYLVRAMFKDKIFLARIEIFSK